jgi:hypothetical protein
MIDATPEQVIEALNLLQEECAEIIQIISKIRRFGFQSYHPGDSEKVTNYKLFNDEVGDFEHLKNYLIEALVIDPRHVEKRIGFKKEKLRKYSNIYDRKENV